MLVGNDVAPWRSRRFRGGDAIHRNHWPHLPTVNGHFHTSRNVQGTH